MGKLNRRVNKFAADLDDDFDALLRVVRAAEIAVVMNYDWNHAPTIQAFDNLAEALEALPEHLRCASGQ